MLTITRQQARQFILARQGLIGAYRFKGKDGAYEYVRQAGCIQFDPVDVCGKNAELTLQSRVKGFKKPMLQELLYEDRKLVDYADKELSIWPAEDWPYFSSYRDRSRRLGSTFEGMDELKGQAIEYIKENGPVCSDTLPVEGEIFWHSSMHWSGNWHKKSSASRSVLEQLYTDGILIIHHKNGSRKYYDLAEKYLPASVLKADNPCGDEEEFLCWRVFRRIGASGLLWDKNSTAFLGIDLNAEKRKKSLERLVSEGKICPVKVEDIKPLFYYRSEDDAHMQAVLEDRADLKPRMSFLAPLDPLLWDKAMVLSLWDFRYSWEIYTPAVKRRYGYYTLPILFGERFVGRIEAVPDRKQGILKVKGLWWEPGIRQTRKMSAALERSLRSFGEFNQCSIVMEEYEDRRKMSSCPQQEEKHMIVLNVTYKCKPDMRQKFLEMIIAEGIDAACRSEDGNMKYAYYLPADGSDDLLLVEKWRDAEALAAHGRQPHYARLGELKKEFVNETVVEKYEC